MINPIGYALLFLLHYAIAFTSPDINFDAIGQLGFAGDYAGVSPYKSTRQFEAITDPGSVVLYNNQTYELLGSANGNILDTCLVPRSDTTFDLYIGGDFTLLNQTKINHIARYDSVTQSLVPLDQGLDGAVYSLYCDTDNVYVGGDFTAPVGAAAETIASFGGHAAIWHLGNQTWGAVPWKGFNGPVFTITRNRLLNTILFGGRFEATGDGQYYNANSSQSVNLGSPTQLSSGNGQSTGSFSNPSNAVCNANRSGQPWLLQDGVPGYWDANFGYPVQPSIFRISNVRDQTHGTQSFSIIALGTNKYFELSYIDPTTQQTTTCSTACVLSDDPNIEYQDFTVLNSLTATGVRIQIDTWYGQGGGLSNVQIYQSDTGVYPRVNTRADVSPCATPAASTNATGNWQEQFVYGTYQNFMTATIAASELLTSSVALTYSPYIPVQGQYAVYATTPGCVGSSTCNERTQVVLTMQFAPGGQRSTITIDQNNYDDKTTLIYSGYIAASTSVFQPTITLSISQNATAIGNTVSIVADSIQFTRNGTNATLVSILEYSPTNYTQNIVPAWRPLADQLMPGSVVHSIDSSSGNILYIGGQFSSLNGTYRGVVSYSYQAAAMVPLSGLGLNGSVYDLALIGSKLFVGGAFSGTLSESSMTFNNVAQYDPSLASWSALGMGFDSPVTKIVASPDNTTLTFSGNFSNQTNTAFGNALWEISSNQWVERKSLIIGTIVSSHSINGTTEILSGSIHAAQTYRADGAAVMDTQQVWTPYIFSQQPIGEIYSGVFWHNITSDGENKTVVIIGGEFTTPNNISNLALYQDGEWHSLGDLRGRVNSMIRLHNLLYIGGEFEGTLDTTHVTSFAIYDLASQSAQDIGGVYSSMQRLPGNINVIQAQPDGNAVYIGGNFTIVNSMQCSSVCKLDTQTRQWNEVTSGISGHVYDIAVASNQIAVVGDIVINDSPAYAARTQGNSWRPMLDQLNGVPTAVLNGPSEVIIGGSDSFGAYVATWDENRLSKIAQLGPTSNIRQMSLIPIRSVASNARYLRATGSMLLVVGHLDVPGYGNVSAAVFDGKDWYPFVMSSKHDGAPGQLRQIFHETTCCNITRIINHLPVPAVILISIAISLGLIFLLIGAGLLALFAKRRNSVKDSPEPMPPYIPGQNRPSSLVAMLDAAQAGTLSAGAAAAISDAAAGPSNEKHNPMSENYGGSTSSGVTPFGALMAAAIASANTDHPASDESPRLFYAKYPFDAKEYGELGLDTGAAVIVTDTSDNVWWMGYKDDGSGNPISGLFPSNYVTETKS